MPSISLALQAALSDTATQVSETLERLLPDISEPEQRVFQAMRYASLGGGKRLRPFLVMTTARLFRVSESAALRVAAAVEMVHCYSLVHDDLPAMDNDDLRRGRPSCHKQFDEATAILAGDALLTRAFEVLANPATHADPQVRCTLVSDLAQAAGAHGMIGGQMIDLLVERQLAPLPAPDVAAITRMHQMKTGRLIGFSCTAGASLGKAPAQLRQALSAYAHDLGLVFQIVDDILDVEGRSEERRVGKECS